MKISKNFTLEEFTKSDTAKKMGIENYTPCKEKDNIIFLVYNVLQPLREYVNEPLIITSGYRCEALNKAVGGVSTSQHTKGQAADVKTSNPKKLLSDLLEMEIDFDQAILYPTFLHISYNIEGNRRQVLYAK